MPKVSVIVPIYNVEQYLEECLDSIINQTLNDIEIICVNDGSTDSSLKILQRYADKDHRIKIINKTNTGYGHSMNIGIDNATGEYIGIVEPDDYIQLNMYEELYNIAHNNDVDFVKSDFYRFKGNNNNLELFYNKLSADDTYYNKLINVNEEIQPYYFIMNTWSGIYNRKFIEKYNIRHNESPGASFQDNGFWFQTFIHSTKAYFTNTPFYMNRRDNPNSSVYNKNKIFTVCDEFEWIENLLRKTETIKNKDLSLFFHIKYLGYMAGYNRVAPQFKKIYLKRFSKDFRKTVKDINFNENLFTKTQLKKLYSIVENYKKFYRINNNIPTFLQQIFSIKNVSNHKIVRILGIKIKLKTKR
ncbi:glycosyltransferase [bacterium]|nr:glycosyltransferase [bacterium]